MLNRTNTAALLKLAQLFNAAPKCDPWRPTEYTGSFLAMDGRLHVTVGVDYVRVEECKDNGYGHMLGFRSAVAPKRLSFAQIVDWAKLWIDNKPALPDGIYRVDSDRRVWSGPELNDEQAAYLKSFAHSKLSAYPIGGSLEFKSNECVGVWGSI